MNKLILFVNKLKINLLKFLKMLHMTSYLVIISCAPFIILGVIICHNATGQASSNITTLSVSMMALLALSKSVEMGQRMPSKINTTLLLISLLGCVTCRVSSLYTRVQRKTIYFAMDSFTRCLDGCFDTITFKYYSSYFIRKTNPKLYLKCSLC